MTRFEINDEASPTYVAYGTDPVTGVFLTAYDKRLETKEKATGEVNAITTKIGVQDGGGGYFDLHTGKTGFGFKVSNAAMRVFLARYGVPEDKINFVFQEASLLMDKDCKQCELDASKSCAKCKTKRYCSRECQVKDWPLHKYICESLPFPPKTISSSVYCFFLPEDGAKIQVVQVELEKRVDKTTGLAYEKPLLKAFMGRDLGEMVLKNAQRKDAVYSVNLKIMTRNMYWAEDEAVESVPNKLVKKLTGGGNSHDWRGPLLVLKFKDVDPNSSVLNFIDVELRDLEGMVDLLRGMLIEQTDQADLFKIY
jgi:hypothetical protein